MINLKKKLFFFIFVFLLINSFFLSIKSELNNKILVKVGNEIITSLDLQNEIITNLVINKKEINQENINEIKNYSIKNLINKKIKQIEVNKYEIKDYNKKDLNNYLLNIASSRFETNILGLKDIFKKNDISFNTFSKNFEIELLWNTLIFSMYKNQTNINLVEVENEINKYKDNKTIEELAEIKKKILDQKKQEKLNLFSRSHFSNLENSIQINFL